MELETDEFSLFDDRARVSTATELVGATSFIKYLLQLTSYDVRFVRRNALTSYKLLTGAIEIYELISHLIRKVDTEEDTEEDWSDYDKYTRAIDPLEEYFFHRNLCTFCDLSLQIVFCFDSLLSQGRKQNNGFLWLTRSAAVFPRLRSGAITVPSSGNLHNA
jgi:hypothetical protein